MVATNTRLIQEKLKIFKTLRFPSQCGRPSDNGKLEASSATGAKEVR